MNLYFKKSLDKLKAAAIAIESSIDLVENHSFEDRQISSVLETVLEDINTAIANIEYFNREAITGVLEQLPNGRFCLEGYELTCGRVLELYAAETQEWVLGRIEHQGTYYFYGNDLETQSLHAGMRARLRT